MTTIMKSFRAYVARKLRILANRLDTPNYDKIWDRNYWSDP